MVSRRLANRKVLAVVLCVVYILFVFVSRHFYDTNHVVSDRYYSSVFVFSFPLFSFVLLFLKTLLQVRLIWVAPFVASVILAYTCFVGFRDNYIDDFREFVQTYAGKTDYIVVPQKEEIRTPHTLFTYKEIIPAEKGVNGYNLFLTDYRYWGHDILIIRKEKKSSNAPLSIPDGTTFKTFAKYRTNKKKDHLCVSVYSPTRMDSTKHDYSISDKNLFKNSDLELQQNESDVMKKFQTWVDDGATFYQNPFLLPRYIELPTQYHIKKIPFYPIAFSETDSPIEGKYSLHVKFNYETYSYYDYHVKLLHAIKSLPGDLSFYAKAIKPNSHLIVSKIENDSHGRWIATEPRYHILLNDTQTHFLSFSFDSYVSLNSLYLLQGVSADVVLDCIQYIPH